MARTDTFVDAPNGQHVRLPSESLRDGGGIDLTGTTRFTPRNDIKNILITGGAGFIGGWMTRHLTKHYPTYNIVCIDKLDDVSSLANMDELSALPNFRFVQCNLADPGVITEILAKHEIDCVLHFAACTHVQNSFGDPFAFTVNNVVATQRLLEAVRHYGGVKRFIHVSTDEVYGDATTDFLDETAPFLPTNPYSASKAAAECYVWAYSSSFNIPIITVRSNNVYGPGQYPEKIIPRFFTLLSTNHPLTIQGSGLHVRRYLYASDAINGFDTVLHKGNLREAYNISSSSAIPNIEVAVRMLQLFGHKPQEFHRHLLWIEDRPFNDHDYRVDGSRLQALGWRQQVSFEEGLKRTVQWYHQALSFWWPHAAETLSTMDPARRRRSSSVRSAKRPDIMTISAGDRVILAEDVIKECDSMSEA